jgi:MoaA/NifB/PqqE/SkfB family radical SAM enzyme
MEVGVAKKLSISIFFVIQLNVYQRGGDGLGIDWKGKWKRKKIEKRVREKEKREIISISLK